MTNCSGDEVKNKMSSFGYSFIEKLESKNKYVVEPPNLDKIVENSSEKNRNFFATYLGLLIYVQAVVFSTTDLNLLHSVEGLRLPIIDITVPLVGFYAVIPIFIIALHFNFLQNIDSHHFKLMQWQAAHPGGKVPRVNIQPFLFDYAILESEGPMWGLVRWANSMLCYNFGPITLGLLLIRYSDCQDYSVTIFHFLAFAFDVWLVWKLLQALKNNEKTISSSPTVATIRSRFSKNISAGLSSLFCLLVFMITLETVLVGGTPNNFFEVHVQPVLQPVEKVILAVNYWLPNLNFATRPIEWVLPRIAIDPNETVWKPDDKAMHMDADLADKSTDWVKYFNENGKGFLSTVHSLRFASLPSQDLRNAQLSGILLQGANLSEAQLEGADLSEAQLEGADLSSAHLQGADLSEAQLEGADLSEAELQGADLSWAHLQGADLSEAQLQGVYLSEAQLQGADLKSAQLQGADLSWAQLQGAYLKVAQLQGADLSEAQLQGADLSWAQLQGANLSEAELQGAIFYLTSIEGTLVSDSPDVFSYSDKKTDMFDITKIDSNSAAWSELNAIAKEITNDERREAYKARIKKAKEAPSYDAEKAWIANNSPKIVHDVLSRICMSQDESYQPSRLSAAQGIHDNYNHLTSDNQFKPTPEYKELLTNIDTTLCSDACKDLRDGIEGLDCKTK